MELAHRLHRKYFFSRTGLGACPAEVRAVPAGYTEKIVGRPTISTRLDGRAPWGGSTMETDKTDKEHWQHQFDQAARARGRPGLRAARRRGGAGDGPDRLARGVPVHPGHSRHRVPGQAVDDPPILRL